MSFAFRASMKERQEDDEESLLFWRRGLAVYETDEESMARRSRWLASALQL